MNSTVLFFLTIFISILSIAAETTLVHDVQRSQSWEEFEASIERLRHEDSRLGTSYIISGTIVTIGSLVAIQNTEDTAAKLVYGIASTAGVAAITYGIAAHYYGNSYNSFYETLKHSGLSPLQKSILVRSYIQNEAERHEKMQRLQMIAHFLAGTLNLYSASIEKDPNAKTVFNVLAGINFILGVSFAF